MATGLVTAGVRKMLPHRKARRARLLPWQLLLVLGSTQAMATPLLQIVSRERLDRPYLWRVVVKAEQPRSLERDAGPGPSRLLGIYTFRVNCQTRWIRNVSGGIPHPPKPVDQQRGYPTGVPQQAFVAACGEEALGLDAP